MVSPACSFLPSLPSVFSGPPDPLHGNSLYQKVRAAAQVSPALVTAGVHRHAEVSTTFAVFPLLLACGS